MLKVDAQANLLALQENAQLLSPKKKDDKKNEKAGKAGKTFLQRLTEKSDETSAAAGLGEALSEAPLSDLLDEVTSLGDELKENPTMDNIKTYRRAVKNFIARVSAEAYQIQEKTTGMGFKKRKKYALIVVVDEKLEQLAIGILQTQKDQLEILRRVDEIRGLLVDLMQ
jgi:uncharacterized protein YaaR (DUF327 family)